MPVSSPMAGAKAAQVSQQAMQLLRAGRPVSGCAPGFGLCAHGRYSHRHGYGDGTLRAEPVPGWLVSTRAGLVN